MENIKFYNIDAIPNRRLKYAVIAAREGDGWLFCRHRDRDTWEIPAGHRAPREDIRNTARRELFEETGALEYIIAPICIYSVTRKTEEFGMLFFAEVRTRGALPDFEISAVERFPVFPPPRLLTYPTIQPVLFQRVQQFLKKRARKKDSAR